MPLSGTAKRTYDRDWRRNRRQSERPHRKLSPLDLDVLRLAIAGYGAPEIADALGIVQEAAFKAFERVAAFLAPTPASTLSIDPAACLPFTEEFHDEIG